MEQHPVPQNVTTFQFRLIGDMTIKQFGYLAGGAIVGYICYKLPLPALFTWPLAALAGLTGAGLAFMPIEDRPMDVWILSFIKSIYSPTEYVWRKDPVVYRTKPAPVAPPQQAPVAQQPPVRQYEPPPVSFVQNTPAAQPPAQTQPHISASVAPRVTADVLRNVFDNAPAQQPIAPVQRPPTYAADYSSVVTAHTHSGLFSWISNLFTPHAQPQQPVIPPNAYRTPQVTGVGMDMSPPPKVIRPVQQTPKEDDKIAEVKQKEEALEHKVESLKYELENKSVADSRILELQKQLTEVLTEKNKMEGELAAMRRQQSAPQAAPAYIPQPTVSPTPVPAAKPNIAGQLRPTGLKGPTVKIITPEGAIKAGLPKLTTFPNVVTGIIKDAENAFLPGVLVTVTDKDGIPVRALKTNRLGQFAASTPLANGVYFVEIEDPRGRYVFDRVQITLNGSIVPALEIVAKSQREVSRAKLAQEIFGTKPI